MPVAKIVVLTFVAFCVQCVAIVRATPTERLSEEEVYDKVVAYLKSAAADDKKWKNVKDKKNPDVGLPGNHGYDIGYQFYEEEIKESDEGHFHARGIVGWRCVRYWYYPAGEHSGTKKIRVHCVPNYRADKDIDSGLPKSVKPGGGYAFYRALTVEGKLVYECRADEAGKFSWSLIGVDSGKLYDENRKSVGDVSVDEGKWVWTIDGKRVTGKLEDGKVSTPKRPGAANWQRFKVTEDPHTLAKYVVRLNTKGGAAPVGGCNATHHGTEARVPFTASYRFYRVE